MISSNPTLTLNVEDYNDMGIQCFKPVAENNSRVAEKLEDIEFTALNFNPAGCRILSFRSEWGREFTPCWYCFDEYPDGLTFEVSNGRSSHGYAPYLFLLESDGTCHVAIVCWSGNWRLDVNSNGEVKFVLSHKILFASLASGERLSLPSVIAGYSAKGLDDMSEKIVDFFEKHWFAPSRISQPIAEWNHWWRFEDAEINEEVFCRNADIAAELGINLCTLDSGWFGDANSPVHWSQCRGDWDIVNQERFPHGLKYLADYVHQKGMMFGLWLEPEAMGNCSRLRKEHPEWEALRDGKSYMDPYICLGANGAADWLYKTIDSLIDQTKCDWIKLDFNLDPGLGCNRSDHGHQPGLGLYNHYLAYYKILDRIKEKYPKLILENCSSGGLRIDTEMLRHTDVTFLSDPDEVPHSLQCLWGASLLISPKRMIHWAWSETRRYPDGSHVFPSFKITEQTPDWEIRTNLRSAMLLQFGLSRDLTVLSQKSKEIFRQEISLYKTYFAPLIQKGKLYRLCNQPLRRGERTDDGRLPELSANGYYVQKGLAAFQLMSEEKGALLLFMLDDDSPKRLFLKGLKADTVYEFRNIDLGSIFRMTGKDLLEKGFLPDHLCKGHSAVYLIKALMQNDKWYNL